MKKLLSIKTLALFLCVTLSFGISIGAIGAIEVSATGTPDAPKNIIFMIGDGMGPNQVGMAHDHIGRDLYMETMPYRGTSETSNSSGQVTDSAAGATALACGIKTRNERIGMTASTSTDPIPVPNIREYFADMGKKTGLVSTVSITDATPAAFGAHNISRANQTQIAAEYIEREIDIIMGGGGSNFSTELRNTAINDKGYSLITTKNQLLSFDGSSKLLALFSDGNLPYYSADYPETVPTLEEMTANSIDILNQNEEGFFLMVEGGLIDGAGHANLIAENIGEVLEFDKAVKVAMDFAEQDGDTLVIVTADHETGGLQKNGTNDYEFTSTGHTGVNVPVFAMGKGAENFQGDMINTDIRKKIKALFMDADTGQNLVTNGDFELGGGSNGTDVTGFTVGTSSTARVVPNTPAIGGTGEYVLYLPLRPSTVTATADYGKYGASTSIAVEAGKVYRWTFDAKLDNINQTEPTNDGAVAFVDVARTAVESYNWKTSVINVDPCMIAAANKTITGESGTRTGLWVNLNAIWLPTAATSTGYITESNGWKTYTVTFRATETGTYYPYILNYGRDNADLYVDNWRITEESNRLLNGDFELGGGSDGTSVPGFSVGDASTARVVPNTPEIGGTGDYVLYVPPRNVTSGTASWYRFRAVTSVPVEAGKTYVWTFDAKLDDINSSIVESGAVAFADVSRTAVDVTWNPANINKDPYLIAASNKSITGETGTRTGTWVSLNALYLPKTPTGGYITESNGWKTYTVVFTATETGTYYPYILNHALNNATLYLDNWSVTEFSGDEIGVVNGDFETGDLMGYTTQAFGDTCLVEVVNEPKSGDNVTLDGYAAYIPDGSQNQYALLQAVTLPAGDYTWGFDVQAVGAAQTDNSQVFFGVYSSRGDSGTGYGSNTATFETDVRNLRANGTSVSMVKIGGATGKNGWAILVRPYTGRVMMDFTLTQTRTVYLSIMTNAGVAAYIDNISLVKQGTDANLYAVTVTGSDNQAYALSPTFSYKTDTYTVSVPYHVTSVDLGAFTGDSEATVAGAGQRALPDIASTANSLAITVTSGDGQAIKTYTVNVIRQRPDENYIETLKAILLKIEPEDAKYDVVNKGDGVDILDLLDAKRNMVS